METTQGIKIHLLTDKDEIALSVQTPKLNLVRMPPGKFGVSIATPRKTEVAISLDGQRVLSTTLRKGRSVLTEDDDGKSFEFTGELVPVPAALPEDHSGSDVAQPAEHRSQGLVAVTVRFADEKKASSSKPDPDQAETVCFKMSLPGPAHNAAVAAHLKDVIPPEDVTDSGCSTCHC